jgi:ArsR family transcriptional regulator, virulence genes transcriptional regulator
VGRVGEILVNIEEVERNIEIAVPLLKALSNRKRLVIACALSEGEKKAGELEKIVGSSQSSVSQHLARLRNDGLVERRREKQVIYYSLKDRRMKAILHCLHGLYCPLLPEQGLTSARPYLPSKMPQRGQCFGKIDEAENRQEQRCGAFPLRASADEGEQDHVLTSLAAGG